MTEQTLHERVRLSVDEGVARLTLVRGAGNALDTATATAFVEAVGLITDAAERDVRVVLIDAEGPAFCVGGDLAAFAAADDPGALVFGIAKDLHRGILALRDLPVPVVTAVHGTVAGGGIGLALAADLVLMASEAKLRLAYSAAGLTPDCGATWFLTGRIGEARTMDLVLTNRMITGAEAAAWGLVSRAVPRAELDAAVAGTVEGLLAGSRSALLHSKRLVAAASRDDLAARLDDEARTLAAAVNSPDGLEGVAAFLGKRAPDFA